MKKIKIYHGLVVLIVLFLASCKSNNTDIVTPQPKAEISATVPLQWNNLFLEVDRYAPGFRPPVAARALAYIGLAAYEGVVPGSTNYQSVAANFSGLSIPKIDATQTYNWEVVTNAVYLTMMTNFFPHVDTQYKTKIADLGTSIYTTLSAKTDKAVYDRSKKFGEDVAKAVFDYSKTDLVGTAGYLNNQPADYVPPSGAGQWQPTFPDYSKAMLPQWGAARTFVTFGADKLAKPPVAYSISTSSPMYSQALEVYATTKSITYEQQWIAEFWSDDIYQLTFEPAARWIAVTNQVVDSKKSNLETALVAYAKVGMALNDGGVACWNSKYVYNLERPISYIRKNIDYTWKSLLNNPIKSVQGVTPPFPAYPSGHSTFGGAAAEALTSVFGFDYGMTDNCHAARTEFIGKPRSFSNFYQMADENAYSRVPLGVHYRIDCEEGLRMGYAVGRKVNALKWKK